jgi:hypothetical protein
MHTGRSFVEIKLKLCLDYHQLGDAKQLYNYQANDSSPGLLYSASSSLMLPFFFPILPIRIHEAVNKCLMMMPTYSTRAEAVRRARQGYLGGHCDDY